MILSIVASVLVITAAVLRLVVQAGNPLDDDLVAPVTRTLTINSLELDDCGGQTGHNFGPCPDWQRTTQEFQSGTAGGDSDTGGPGTDGAAAAGPGPGGDCR